MKASTVISEQRILNKIVSRKDVKSIEVLDYKKDMRNKIVTFVPPESIDKVFKSMSAAGAGRIGQYSMCSFMVNGVGTFKAGKSSKPYSGKKDSLSFEEEIRLEMECGDDELKEVVNEMLNSHPYEEPAYEIYRFTKFKNESDGILVTLNKPVELNKIFKATNNFIDDTVIKTKGSVRKFILIENGRLQGYANDKSYDVLISYNSKKFKFNKKV